MRVRLIKHEGICAHSSTAAVWKATWDNLRTDVFVGVVELEGRECQHRAEPGRTEGIVDFLVQGRRRVFAARQEACQTRIGR
jgi:hypothetical protein